MFRRFAVVGILLFAPLLGAELTGVVRDPTRVPIPKAQVRLLSQSGLAKELHTDKSGRFALTSLPEDTYNLVIFSPGFETYRVSAGRLAVEDRRELELTLGLGSFYGSNCRNPGPKMRTWRRWQRSADRGAISGKATFAGTFVGFPGAKVRLICPDHQLCAIAVTDSEGQYGFTDLQPGSYLLEIQEPGFILEKLPLDVLPGFETVNDVIWLDWPGNPARQTITFCM